ncbi:unnamed protein product [Gordionus sp. m RMFG-2023]|uniref:uncharacterized protein LOC135924005 n=1 Tax=Gordionus sp. m RMFG-2023 TaxID=3053472 RepID=UPI0030E061DE
MKLNIFFYSAILGILCFNIVDLNNETYKTSFTSKRCVKIKCESIYGIKNFEIGEIKDINSITYNATAGFETSNIFLPDHSIQFFICKVFTYINETHIGGKFQDILIKYIINQESYKCQINNLEKKAKYFIEVSVEYITVTGFNKSANVFSAMHTFRYATKRRVKNNGTKRPFIKNYDLEFTPKIYKKTTAKLSKKSKKFKIIIKWSTGHLKWNLSSMIDMFNLVTGISPTYSEHSNQHRWYKISVNTKSHTFQNVEPNTEYVVTLGFIFKDKFSSLTLKANTIDRVFVNFTSDIRRILPLLYTLEVPKI